jgi:hypothetical protein
MSYKDRKTLFIFLDEAGNLDFSPKGSKFWSLTAVCTFHPVAGRGAFWELLYSLADDGAGQECFHATEDRQAVRDEVFKIITQLADDLEIHSVIAEKRKTHPSFYRRTRRRGNNIVQEKDEGPFYDLICRVLLRYLFKRKKFAEAARIVVVLSSLFTKAKHDALLGSLKKHLKEHTKVPFSIYFHHTKADVNCQVADYCGWAITIKWERGETRSYDLIKTKVKSEFEIFQHGNRTYY